jgi:hypothetical protein
MKRLSVLVMAGILLLSLGGCVCAPWFCGPGGGPGGGGHGGGGWGGGGGGGGGGGPH